MTRRTKLALIALAFAALSAFYFCGVVFWKGNTETLLSGVMFATLSAVWACRSITEKYDP